MKWHYSKMYGELTPILVKNSTKWGPGKAKREKSPFLRIDKDHPAVTEYISQQGGYCKMRLYLKKKRLSTAILANFRKVRADKRTIGIFNLLQVRKGALS